MYVSRSMVISIIVEWYILKTGGLQRVWLAPGNRFSCCNISHLVKTLTHCSTCSTVSLLPCPQPPSSPPSLHLGLPCRLTRAPCSCHFVQAWEFPITVATNWPAKQRCTWHTCGMHATLGPSTQGRAPDLLVVTQWMRLCVCVCVCVLSENYENQDSVHVY